MLGPCLNQSLSSFSLSPHHFLCLSLSFQVIGFQEKVKRIASQNIPYYEEVFLCLYVLHVCLFVCQLLVILSVPLCVCIPW
jgi:hypothetical protein